jgi:hypothetical protein
MLLPLGAGTIANAFGIVPRMTAVYLVHIFKHLLDAFAGLVSKLMPRPEYTAPCQLIRRKRRLLHVGPLNL